MNNPLWRYAPSPFSRIAVRCGKGDAASAAGRPLRGGCPHWVRQLHRSQVKHSTRVKWYG